MKGEVLHGSQPPRTVHGPVLKVTDPISFWGGVSPADGRLTDPRSAQHGVAVTGTVLSITQLRGSSSASSILLELIYRGLAPVAIVLAEPDAILALGILVAREMGWTTPILLRLSVAEQARLPQGVDVVVDSLGVIQTEAPSPEAA